MIEFIIVAVLSAIVVSLFISAWGKRKIRRLEAQAIHISEVVILESDECLLLICTSGEKFVYENHCFYYYETGELTPLEHAKKLNLAMKSHRWKRTAANVRNDL